jgi:hypothetical protein
LFVIAFVGMALLWSACSLSNVPNQGTQQLTGSALPTAGSTPTAAPPSALPVPCIDDSAAAPQQSFPGYVLVDPHLAEFGTPQCDASRLYCSVKVSVVYVSAGTIKWVRTVINSPRSNLYLSDGVTPRRKVLLTCVDQLGRWEWWTAAVSDRY